MIATEILSIRLNEAEITHGRSFSRADFDLLPPSVQKRLIADAERNGISEKQLRAMLVADNNPHGENKISLHGKDPLEGLYMHELEQYNKAQDMAILQSNDLVKAYNQMVDGHIDDAMKCIKRMIDAAGDYKDASEDDMPPEIMQDIINIRDSFTGIKSVLANMGDIVEMQNEYDLSDADVKKYIADAMFQPADNPEEVKRIINARIAYNNAIVSMFQQMLKVNYAILGLTKDEALLLSEKIGSEKHEEKAEGINALKAAFMENEAKFRTGNHWDLRSVGGGCIFMTDEDVGDIAKDVQLDRMLQMTMTYDAIVIGHGSSTNKKAEAVFERRMNDIKKQHEALNDARQKRFEELDKAHDEFYKNLDRIRRKDNKIHQDLRKRIDRIYADIDAREKSHKQRLDQIYEMRMQALNDHDFERYDKYTKFYETIDADNDRLIAEYRERIKVLNAKYDAIIAWYMDGSEYNKAEIEGQKKLDTIKADIEAEQEKFDKLREKSHEDHERYVKEYTRIKRKYNAESTWTIQPVKTLRGGPFEDVNDLVRQLIKEGFKNIMLVSCNPGHHQLAKDIRDTPGFKIHHAENSLLSENTTSYDDPFYEVDKIISECELSLIETCKEYGFWYGDNDFINESLEWGLDSSNYTEILTEGVLATAWSKIKELVKKALAFLIALFKKIISFFKNIIDRIKSFFKKVFDGGKIKKDFKKPVTSSAILVENARVNKYSAKSWDQMQQAVIRSCETIAKKIQATEQKQTKNMQELERYADKKSKSVNESSDIQMDNILALIL